MAPDSDVVGAMLVVSSAFFIIGAALAPESPRVFSAPLAEHLAIVGRHHGQWRLMNSLMIVSIITTSASLIVFSLLLNRAGDSFRGVTAATAYALVGVLWVLSLTFRQTVIVWAAGALAGREPPAWLEPLQQWTGLMYWVYMTGAYLSIAVLGWAVLETGVINDAIGWFAVGFGAVAGAGFISGQPRTPIGALFEPPFWVHVVPIVFGVALLVSP